MSAVAFDSLRVTRRLREAGLPQEQAEALVEAAVDATTELTTKGDLRELEQRLTIKLGAVLVAAVGAVVALLKVFA